MAEALGWWLHLDVLLRIGTIGVSAKARATASMKRCRCATTVTLCFSRTYQVRREPHYQRLVMYKRSAEDADADFNHRPIGGADVVV